MLDICCLLLWLTPPTPLADCWSRVPARPPTPARCCPGRGWRRHTGWYAGTATLEGLPADKDEGLPLSGA